MPESIPLTDLQIELMRALWSKDEATVVEVHQEISKQRDLAQGTIATLLNRLEKKGAITHRTEGRQFVYRALVSEAEVRRSMLAQVADRLFGGDVPLLIHQLLAEREVSPGDLAEVKALIAERETGTKRKPAK
ncbi:MAG: BlaI/MecI/CopY family transcriptional regulator [Anaerolineae bacterium]|nr:BlaI/MecI/CopY family transcriptional regulator [Gemmatimonadaceae bacterium]